MLLFHKIPGLRDEDKQGHWYYKYRNLEEDRKNTKEYYTQNPPKEGDLVVVLSTQFTHRVDKPEILPIKAITKQKRLVVNHSFTSYAGRSFWMTGQNCYAPKGQVHLVPAELYRDIPIAKSLYDKKVNEELRKSNEIDIKDFSDFYGGMENVIKHLKWIMQTSFCSYEKAKEEMQKDMDEHIQYQMFNLHKRWNKRNFEKNYKHISKFLEKEEEQRKRIRDI